MKCSALWTLPEAERDRLHPLDHGKTCAYQGGTRGRMRIKISGSKKVDGRYHGYGCLHGMKGIKMWPRVMRWVKCGLYSALTPTGPILIIAMHVEWAKMCAQSCCWREEVWLLTKEMLHVIMYCAWKSRWWKCQRAKRDNCCPGLAAGFSAYAIKQFDVYEGLAKSFGKQWSLLLHKHMIDIEWPAEFTDNSGL